jgi:hypothetical protein
MSTEPLLSVYLLTGSDRPKHLRALAVFVRASARRPSSSPAESTTGADAVASRSGCSAGTGGRLVMSRG